MPVGLLWLHVLLPFCYELCLALGGCDSAPFMTGNLATRPLEGVTLGLSAWPGAWEELHLGVNSSLVPLAGAGSTSPGVRTAALPAVGERPHGRLCLTQTLLVRWDLWVV